MARSTKPSPILEEVLRFNAGRKPKRVALKLQRMSLDAFSFFRGADHLLAGYWARLRPPEVGPDVLQCGDLHLENFGAYQTDDGDFLYDINDFDEALVAPCGLDLARGTTSILIAAEMWKLTPLQATGMALEFLDQYRAAVTAPPHVHADAGPAPHTGRGPIWDLLGETAQASQAALLDHHTVRTKGGERRIVRSEAKHPAVKKSRAKEIREAVKHYGQSRPDPDAFRVLDVTARIAGTGSLGVQRYLALVAGGGTPATNRLLDIKQCLPSSLLPCTDALQPDTGGDEALRVVRAQRALQAKPAAGLDVLPVGDTTYRIREMIPDDNRTSLSRFQKDPGEAPPGRRGRRPIDRLVAPARGPESRAGRPHRRLDDLGLGAFARRRARLRRALRGTHPAGLSGVLHGDGRPRQLTQGVADQAARQTGALTRRA